jgi:hypothetical protein
LENGSFSTVWACSPGAASGSFSAVAYCWNTELGRDALARCEIEIERPRLDLQWKSLTRDADSGEAVLTAMLENRSKRFSVKAEVRLLIDGEEAQGEPVELNPAEERDLEYRIDPETGAQLKIEARLADEYPLMVQSREDAQPIRCEIHRQASAEGPAEYLAVDRSSSSNRLPVCLLSSRALFPNRFEASIWSSTEPLISLNDAASFADGSALIQIPLPAQPLESAGTPATLMVSIAGKASSGMPVEASWSLEFPSAAESDLALNRVEVTDSRPAE